jgi:hypothetical protein
METPLQSNSSAQSRAPESAEGPPQQPYLSFAELARRWRVSRATVYNRLRAVGAEVLDFAARGKKGRKVIALNVVLQIEQRRMKRLR